ncbi:MAG TPA: efflux RND transporter periplasmic adaptor subunit [Deltaproteobacteria bacterium]|nr:efflux RND transporter periplasmic adaptor subunit [Deltaproteobacteria bacterium]
MSKRLPAIIILILIIAATGIYVFYTRNSSNENSIKVSGNIEVTDIRLSFRIAGRLDSLLVNEGDIVSKGQLIAQLEKSDQELSLKQARANMQYAQSVLAELETGSRKQEIEHARAELSRAQAGVETARAQLELAKADDERFARLYKQGGISLREYQVYQTQFEIARNAHKEALARLESAGQQLSLVEEGARSEKIDQARSQLKIARERLQQAKLFLDYTDLYSPIDAVVLSKSTEPGEYMTPGSPVITIGDLKRPWLRAYINETDLGKVKLNQEVEVTSDTYPGKIYTGRISFISPEAEFTPKAVQTHDERVKLVYRIKIALENPEDELKPGMPADALIKLHE